MSVVVMWILLLRDLSEIHVKRFFHCFISEKTIDSVVLSYYVVVLSADVHGVSSQQ